MAARLWHEPLLSASPLEADARNVERRVASGDEARGWPDAELTGPPSKSAGSAAANAAREALLLRTRERAPAALSGVAPPMPSSSSVKARELCDL